MFFLERESWSQPYQMFLIALSLIMPPNIQFRFGDEAIWRKVWQGVVFMQNFWNFKAIPKTEIILTSIQSRLILKKFKWFLWRGFQMWWKLFCFDFLMKNMKWHLVGHKKVEISIWGLMRTVFQRKCEEHEVTSGWSQKGLNFNLRVNENRLSTKMWKTQSDIWWVTKGWNINLRVIENRLSTKMWKTQSDIWWVTKGWNINLRVNENRVSTKMWKTQSDIWWVTKGWNINLRVIENRAKHSFYLNE